MVTLVTYANEKYYNRQDLLCKEANLLFDNIDAYREKDLEAEFLRDYREILSSEKGAGYWLWKPYLIDKTMKELGPDDIIFYMDCGDIINGDIRNFFYDYMSGKDIVLTKGSYYQYQWTKRDCFVGMNCDEHKYYNAIQIEAGVIAIRNTIQMKDIVNEWFMYCRSGKLITDEPNTMGKPNLEGFKEHRHDQSILTNLAVKYNLYQSNEIRKYVHCNKR